MRFATWFNENAEFVSAGVLLARMGQKGLEVLLVHPANLANAPWSIPKGEVDPGEQPIQTACRELGEEVGIFISSLAPFAETQPYASRRPGIEGKTKKVVVFLGHDPQNQEPKVATWEINGAAFFPIETAKKMIHPAQQFLLSKLEDTARSSSGQDVSPSSSKQGFDSLTGH